jgi:hypothetical protein
MTGEESKGGGINSLPENHHTMISLQTNMEAPLVFPSSMTHDWRELTPKTFGSPFRKSSREI